MIIQMSKVELVGPKVQLLATLKLLQGKGVFQPEADIHGCISAEDEARIKEILLDETAAGKKLFFVSLQERITELLANLPDLPTHTTDRHPLPIIDVLDALVEKHLATCRSWQQQAQRLREEEELLSQHLRFWTVLEPLVAEVGKTSRLAFFGVRVRNPDEISTLRSLLDKKTAGSFRLTTASLEEGSIVGLITTNQRMEEPLRRLLYDEQVPELTLPNELAGLPFREKSRALRRLQAGTESQLHQLAGKIESFTKRWLPTYRQALDWLDERLSLYQATASVYETRHCFLVHGWMATENVKDLQRSLKEQYRGQVVLSELEVPPEEVDRVPVLLRNPRCLKPFELFARLLPLPKYNAYDPTPFLGLFFPLLFGMILGDIGYGLLLVLLAAILIRFCPGNPLLVDGAKILGVSAVYAILFGLLFGELFGDLGAHLFQLQPLWQERSQAIVPMIAFAISVGTAHILLGLLLGIHYDLKRHLQREALAKISTLLLILLSGLWLLSSLFFELQVLNAPLLATTLLLLALLIAAGGGLAPLELLKNFGNIISYVRIMAIGLSSVMLAQVANRLGGIFSDLMLGVLVAGLLHLFNLTLGIFAPTVHALRLHYVEFFSKFLEFGGRQFKPLSKHR